MKRGITRNVLVAGLTSLLTDASSEMIYPVLPLFLANVLGVGAVGIGVIEGIAETTASLLKVVSGYISDRAGERKRLMLLGYGLSNIIKPFLALTTVWEQVLAVRLLDRAAKGIRGAPRDALIADSTPADCRGKAFGFHRAMDTLGAAIGPLCAAAILAASADNFRLVFLIAAAPGVLSVAVLLFFLREKRRAEQSRPSFTLSLRGLGRPFLIFSAIATLFALGNSSDAFLILRAQDLGLAVALVPLAYFVFNVVYAILAAPLGHLSDRIGRRTVIGAGYFVFAAVYLGFALANASWLPWALFAIYGAYYALTEGVQRAFVADLVPANLRGSAMGTFNALVGFSALPASVIGGMLWQSVAPSATFLYGAGLAGLAAVLFILLPSRWLSNRVGASLT